MADVAIEMANVPSDKQLKYLTPKIVGEALEYFKNYTDQGKNSCDEFKQILLEQFTPIDHYFKIEEDHYFKIEEELLSIKHYGNFRTSQENFCT